MVRAPIVPIRWQGHGLDLRTYVGDDEPLFVAADVHRALAIPLEYGDLDWVTGRRPALYAFPTVGFDWIVDRDGARTEFFTIAQVRELAADQPMYAGDEFSTWFDSILIEHGGDRLEQLAEALTPEEPGRTELQAGRTFSVARAATILSNDPALNFGQKVLFDTLAGYMNWIHREDNIWVPTRDSLRAGYLVRHNVRVGNRNTLYPQIRITHTGLEHLHQRFGGIAALSLDPTPQLTLLELP